MSLNYNTTQIADHKALHQQQTEAVKTQAIIFASMAVGISEITEKTWKEFAARLWLWQRVLGPMLATDAGLVEITAEDVKRRIGLKTNASPRTKANFMAALHDEAVYQVNKAK